MKSIGAFVLKWQSNFYKNNKKKKLVEQTNIITNWLGHKLLNDDRARAILTLNDRKYIQK